MNVLTNRFLFFKKKEWENLNPSFSKVKLNFSADMPIGHPFSKTTSPCTQWTAGAVDVNLCLWWVPFSDRHMAETLSFLPNTSIRMIIHLELIKIYGRDN